MVRHYAKIIGAAVYLTVWVQIPLREKTKLQKNVSLKKLTDTVE